ncbi:MAG: uroporphyrinogen-III synthase [Georgenia sp.]
MTGTAAGLARRRILVPRPRPGDAIVAAVHAAGGEAVPTELVRSAVVEPTTELDAALRRLPTCYAWLAVTSPTTVEILLDRAAALDTTLPSLIGAARVAAVGPGTARTLTAAGVGVDLVPTGESSAAALVAAWPRPTAGAVLFPRSEIAAPTLADGLRALGLRVDDIVAYRTRTAPSPDEAVAPDLAGGRIDAVLLTSPSTARALVSLYGVPPARICAIGAATAQAATEAGLRVHAVAAEQTPAGLVAAAARALSDAPPAATKRLGSTSAGDDPGHHARGGHPFSPAPNGSESS